MKRGPIYEQMNMGTERALAYRVTDLVAEGRRIELYRGALRSPHGAQYATFIVVEVDTAGEVLWQAGMSSLFEETAARYTLQRVRERFG